VETMSPATDNGTTPLIIPSQDEDGYDAVGRKLRRTIIRVSAVCLLILVVAGVLCGIILATNSKPDSTTNCKCSTAAPDISDCQWSPWSQWRPCSQYCQGGEQLRTRNKTRHQEGDGQACEGGHEESRRCNTWPCPGYPDCSGGGEALNEAAAAGKVTEAQGLIGCPGIDINYADSNGETALWKAAFAGHLEVVQLLLNTPGINVSKAGGLVPDNVRGEFRGFRVTEATPLFAASTNGHADVVRELLSHPQTDPNQARTSDGATPLFIASQHGNEEVVRELLCHPQTKPNQVGTTDGYTPLYIASGKGHDAVVRELLCHPQTKPNQDTWDDWTSPLFIASLNGYAAVVKELLADRRVDTNNHWNNNAIMVAAGAGKLEVVKLLLRCPKVKLGVKNKDGKTELDLAKEKGHQDVVEALESRSSYLQQESTCPN